MGQINPKMTSSTHISIRQDHLEFIKKSEYSLSKLVRKVIQNLMEKQKVNQEDADN